MVSQSLRFESKRRLRRLGQTSFARGGVVDPTTQAAEREGEIAGALGAKQEQLARAKEVKLREEEQSEVLRSNVARERQAAKDAETARFQAETERSAAETQRTAAEAAAREARKERKSKGFISGLFGK